MRLTHLCGVEVDTIGVDGVCAHSLGVNTFRGKTASRSNLYASLGSRGQRYVGHEFGVDSFTIAHIITDLDNLGSILREIEGAFYSTAGPEPCEPCEMRFLDEGVAKIAYVVPVGLSIHPSNPGGCYDNGMYQGEWELLGPLYYSELPGSEADENSIAVGTTGSDITDRVTYTLSPTAADRKRIRFNVVNRSSRPLINHPTCLTRATVAGAIGWNHAAQVLATVSQADGTDVAVLVDNIRVSRWSGNWNSATTHIWYNANMPAGRSFELDGAILAADTTASLVDPIIAPPGPTFMVMASTGEVMRVTNVDGRTITLERGQRDTTAAGASGTLWWLPPSGMVDLTWGGPSDDSYVDDRYKPCINLSTSTNSQWQYAEYYETGIAGDSQARYPRAAGWGTRSLGSYDREIYGGSGDQYWRWIASDDGDPATALGIVYNAAGPIAGRPLVDRWDLNLGVLITRYKLAWDASTINYEGTTPPLLKEARLAVIHIDRDGNEIRAAELDFDAGGSGPLDITNANAYGISLRVEPFDRTLFSPGTGAALEPTDGDGWGADTVELYLDDIPGISWDSSVVEDAAWIEATLGSGAGSIKLDGILLDLDGSLVLTEESAVIDGLYSVNHLVRGAFPLLLPDGDTVTIDQTDIGVTVDWYDAWN